MQPRRGHDENLSADVVGKTAEAKGVFSWIRSAW